MSSQRPKVPISDAIQGIRRELTNAIAAGEQEELRFNVDSVEIEFQVEVALDVEGKAGAKGGIQFGVISIGEVSGEMGVTRSHGTTHTVKLTLTPKTEQGGDIQILDPNAPDETRLD